MASLYQLGWRQGSLINVPLPVGGLSFSDTGTLIPRTGIHSEWVLATQDCDLDSWTQEQLEPLVELRPRFPISDQGSGWGIRSRVCRLDNSDCVISDEPPIRLPPAAIVELTKDVAHGETIPAERILALKTWLGKRYDRPAVPPHLTDLARDIAKRARKSFPSHIRSELHDVLMQFKDQGELPQFFLFGVIIDGGDRVGARSWLAEVGTSVPAELGVLGGVEVGYKSETSLELIENSYSADLTQLTWSEPGPIGAI
ncbi:MAG: hypothetical protein HKL80_11875 [Acidimicrobiales bacterium]|nr:hypothetical protein [Acidimicrobiales bacterium]